MVLKSRCIAFVMLAAFSVAAFSIDSFAAEPALPDIRLIVDISGSMKLNDPNNLRQPAVKLVTELLPEDSEAGVWTFGQYVNMLISHGRVDQEWRQYARSRVPQINSVALRTNIGEALEVASDDFFRQQPRDNTHFFLLTDGVVDIVPASRDDSAARNRAERERILTEVVPRLVAKGARIHTIALSANADIPLLKQIAQSSKGSFTIAETDRELSRAFLEALDRVGATEEVPLEGNRFVIDDSISEFTAVIFHDSDNSSLGLRSPAGEAFYQSDTSQQQNVRWLGGADYSLVTVESPAGGEWALLGDLGEGSRVKVVTDLKMTVSELPAYFFAQQEIPIEVAFRASGEVITDPDFLRFLTVTVEVQTEDGRSGVKTLQKEGPEASNAPRDGIYRDLISRLKAPGEYTVVITADGQTFKRQSRQTMVLRPPLDVEVAGSGQGEESTYLLRATVGQPNLVPEKTQISAHITGADTGKEIMPFRDGDEPGVWVHTMEQTMGEGEYQVTVELQAETITGNQIRYTAGPLTLTLPRPSDTPGYQAMPPAEEPEVAPTDPQPEPSPPPAAEPEPQVPAPVEQPDAEPEQAGGVSAPMLIGGGFLLVVLLGIGGFLFYRKKRSGSAEDVSDQSGDAPAAAEEEPMPVLPEQEVNTDSDSTGLASATEEDAEPPVSDNAPLLQEETEDTDALADGILAENAADESDAEADLAVADFGEEDEEFSLEDLDLSDVDDPFAEDEEGDKDKR